MNVNYGGGSREPGFCKNFYVKATKHVVEFILGVVPFEGKARAFVSALYSSS